MSQKLKPSFSFIFGGIVWNTLSNAAGNHLVLEIRNEEKHLTSFSAIDVDKKLILWSNVSFDEKWWVSLSGIQGQITLLNIYENNQSPEPTGVLAISLDNGKVLWSKKDFSLIGADAQHVLGYLNDSVKEKVTGLSIIDGSLISDDFDMGSLNEKGINIENKKIISPFHYTEGTEYFETVQRFINKVMNVESVRAFDYLETHEYIIIAYYINNEGMLDNYLLVLDIDGKPLLNILLEDKLKGIGREVFFVTNNTLIFVRKKKELVGINI